MKALYESILDDIDMQMQQGDDWVKEIEKEKKEFLKELGLAKNYDGGYSLKNGRSTGFFVPNALKELGYDANHIKIMMYTMDSFNYGDHGDEWMLEVSLSKYDEDDTKNFRKFIGTIWEKKVYIDRWTADNWRGIVKNVIKPTTKSLDQFKKFLDNMEKLNGQFISPSSLLK